MRRNYGVPIINTMMIIKIKGLSMEGEGGSLILTLIEEVDSLSLIGEIGFLILSVTKEEDIQILMSLGSFF